jgi:6-phosphofructokinase
MAKLIKTKKELQQLVASEMGTHCGYLVIFPSKAYGWDANIISAAPLSSEAKARLEQVITELRFAYDLDE